MYVMYVIYVMYVMYRSRVNYVSMRSSYVANFERSWLEVRSKLGRSSFQVGPKFFRS